MSFKNLDAFKKRLEKKLITYAHKNAKAAVTRSTMVVENFAKASVMAGGSRTTVQKYDPSRTHTQSKPLSPPASDTGYLVNNIFLNVDVFMVYSINNRFKFI